MRDEKPVQPLSGFFIGNDKFDVVGSCIHKGRRAVSSANKSNTLHSAPKHREPYPGNANLPIGGV
jgi:hypothetical protein